jgi:ribosomal protein S18 acetylase RimI-like enzyme
VPEIFLVAMTRAHLAQAAILAGQLGYPSSPEEVKARFDRIDASRDDYLCVAATTTLAVAGWIHLHAGCTLESDPDVEVLGLVVDERGRGRGVGRALMVEAERWARERGAAAIRLRSNVVREGAHAFYERLGFRIVKTQYAFEKRLSVQSPL